MADETTILSNLKKCHSRNRKRIGRGDGSTGSYAGRGLKGQRSRSGGRRGMVRRSLKHLIGRVPKRRGFKSITPSKQTVTIDMLNRQTKAGQTILDPKIMKQLGLIRSLHRGVKIVGSGKLSHALTIKAHGFAKQSESSITAAGGQAIIIVNNTNK
ncbi:MAG: uL15 family ribosomal protein [Patescibacteria group bacterium]